MVTETQWYEIGRKMLEVYSRVFLQMDRTYNAPLPSGAFVMSANHPTSMEPAFLPLLMQRPMSIMISKSVFSIPGVGAYLRAAGHITVVRGSGLATLSQALRSLEAGRPVAIFPEGGLSPLRGGFLRPHSGAVRLALGANVPIVPVGIAVERSRIHPITFSLAGNKEVAHFYLSGRMVFNVGVPMTLEGDANDWQQVERLSRQMMDEVQSLACAADARLPRRSSTLTLPFHDRKAEVEP